MNECEMDILGLIPKPHRLLDPFFLSIQYPAPKNRQKYLIKYSSELFYIFIGIISNGIKIKEINKSNWSFSNINNVSSSIMICKNAIILRFARK